MDTIIAETSVHAIVEASNLNPRYALQMFSFAWKTRKALKIEPKISSVDEALESL